MALKYVMAATPEDSDSPEDLDLLYFMGVSRMFAMRNDADESEEKQEKANQQDPSSWIGKYIEGLNDRYSTAVRLHYLESYTYLQIATEFRCPVSTAKSYVHRGMERLRRLEDGSADKGNRKHYPYKRTDIQEEDLAKIPGRFRKVVSLYCLEKLSYSKIAQLLEIPIGTVKSYVNRGMKYLLRKEEDS
jgi:DNA-directed RNA polymerase specialized sigma24 family protein